MEQLMDLGQSLNLRQSQDELWKTKFEADAFNKSLKKSGKEPVKELGKEEFLKLLITELQHQDPTNPMQDREFIAQMAQFSSLEQMLNINNSLTKFIEGVSFQSSYSLLGLNVEIDNSDASGEAKSTVEGLVESVSRQGNETFVKINGEEYSASKIIKIKK